MENTVLDICAEGLCIGCGICAGVCPNQCIDLLLKNGQSVINIADNKCTECGLCRRVCPQAGFDYTRYNVSADNFWFGNYMQLFTAQCYDKEILKRSTSGGVVTQLVQKLLEDGYYDSVFTVGSYCHRELTCAENFSSVGDLKNTPKSRYIMVSHENTIRYMKMNKEKRIIIIATPCAVHGLISAIDLLKLNRDNYLLIGLFCDKTMTNEVFYYFEDIFSKGVTKLDKIHFRTKDVGNWPGGVRLFWEDGTCTDLSNKERMAVKEYFQPEGCLYCLDKLNFFADISVGDNYTGANTDIMGTSSVILRSQLAVDIWEQYKGYFIFSPEKQENIFNSQKIQMRKRNLAYALYRGIRYNLPEGVSLETVDRKEIRKYKKKLKKIEAGRVHNYKQIYKISRNGSKGVPGAVYRILKKIIRWKLKPHIK